MKEFPSRLTPKNKDQFSNYCYNRNIAYLRKEIYELVIMGDENSYFELDKFERRHKLKKGEIEKMSDTVSEELVELGWNVKKSFGNTGLFIYSSEDPPPSCYDDEF